MEPFHDVDILQYLTTVGMLSLRTWQSDWQWAVPILEIFEVDVYLLTCVWGTMQNFAPEINSKTQQLDGWHYTNSGPTVQWDNWLDCGSANLLPPSNQLYRWEPVAGTCPRLRAKCGRSVWSCFTNLRTCESANCFVRPFAAWCVRAIHSTRGNTWQTWLYRLYEWTMPRRASGKCDMCN